jgi:hypothetical protein
MNILATFNKQSYLTNKPYQLVRNFLFRVPRTKNTPFERARKAESNDVVFTERYSQVPSKNF